MHKRADAYRSIGEAARLVGVATHVLRYWESQFPQLKPMRRPDGRRYYRPDDVRLAAGLAAVLREDGLTTRGAARLIAKDGGAALRMRGATRLPESFAMPQTAPEAADPPDARLSAESPVEEETGEPAAQAPAGQDGPPSAAGPLQRATDGDLPLFPGLAADHAKDGTGPGQPQAADSRVTGLPSSPLLRISALLARLHRMGGPAPAGMEGPQLRAIASLLRDHLAMR